MSGRDQSLCQPNGKFVGFNIINIIVAHPLVWKTELLLIHEQVQQEAADGPKAKVQRTHNCL